MGPASLACRQDRCKEHGPGTVLGVWQMQHTVIRVVQESEHSKGWVTEGLLGGRG